MNCQVLLPRLTSPQRTMHLCFQCSYRSEANNVLVFLKSYAQSKSPHEDHVYIKCRTMLCCQVRSTHLPQEGDQTWRTQRHLKICTKVFPCQQGTSQRSNKNSLLLWKVHMARVKYFYKPCSTSIILTISSIKVFVGTRRTTIGSIFG